MKQFTYGPMTFPLVALTSIIVYILYLVTFPIQSLIARHDDMQKELIDNQHHMLKNQNVFIQALKKRGCIVEEDK